ncbi:MAG TPA: hypothetical protein VFF06_18870 [Polyangia bacterium]|nr:hypothetical protein [Polyangia bacterium]
MFKTLIASFALLLTGCDTPPSTPKCPADKSMAQIVGTAQFTTPQTPLDSDLVVTGTAQHQQGLAIRQVLAEGVEATNTGFNFSTWTVTVPVATLAASAVMGQTTLVVNAVDSCDATAQIFRSMPFAVTVTPGIRVTQLDATITPPDTQGFIPSNNTIPAVLQITANPEAAGAVAQVGASIGTIQGAPSGTVTLSGDGKMPASASLLFVSNKAGNALITVSAGNLTRARPVLVADAPNLIPASATLGAGQQLTVSALSQGNVQSCQISTGGAGLTATATKMSETRTDIAIKAAATAASGTALQVICLDAFGQQSSPGVYTVQ